MEGILHSDPPRIGSERRMVEPEVVATSPNRIKSPVPVCCGFDSVELVLAAGLAPALATLSTSCLCIGLREQSEWGLQPVMLRQEFFTKEIRRLLHGGKNGPPSEALTKVGRSLRCCPGPSGLMKPA